MGDVREPQKKKKALQQLKRLIQEYSVAHFEGNVTLWGIPILGDDERLDLSILKFLRARNFEVLDALEMIKNALHWRNEFGIETLLVVGEDDDHYEKKVMFTNGHDRQGCPVWYLVFEECLSYSSLCSSDVLLLRSLVRFVEKNVMENMTDSFVLIIDLKNCPYYEYREMYRLIYKFLQLLNDNYPEFVSKQIWVHASWWYRNYCRVYSAVFDEWSMTKVVFTGSTKTIDTLFKYISPDQVPVKYGGLRRDDDQECSELTSSHTVSDVTIKPSATHAAEFSFAQECDIIWDFRVVGWDVCYEAEYVPSTKGRYITNISKLRKLTPNDEDVVITDNYRVTEAGKLVLTIHNTSSEKKKFLVRVRVMAFNLNMDDGPSLRGWLLQSESDE